MAGLDWRSQLPQWSAAASPIGVDFDADWVHSVQVDRRGASLRIRGACSLKHGSDLETLLSSKSDLKRLIGEMVGRGGFRGRRIVTQAPSADLRLMVLNYSADRAKSEPEQILDLARERMRNDLVEHVVDFVPIRTSGEQQGDRSALVAVTPEDPVIQFLERLRAAGLEVSALEIAPVAIRRLLATTVEPAGPAAKKRIALVLRMGKTTSEITVLSGRRLLLYREVEVGLETLVESVTKGLECDLDTAHELITSYGVIEPAATDSATLEFSSPPDQGNPVGSIAGTMREVLRPALRTLVEQAHKAISYAAFQTRGRSIEKLYLMEGAATCPGLDGLLAEMLQLPVEPLQPISGVDGFEDVAAKANTRRLGLAFGFALRGVVDV